MTYPSPSAEDTYLIPPRLPVSQPAQHRGGVEQQQLVADLLAAAQPPHHLLHLHHHHHLFPLEELLLPAGEEEERRDQQLAQRSPEESGDQRGGWRGGARQPAAGTSACKSRQIHSSNQVHTIHIAGQEMELVNSCLGNSLKETTPLIE